MRAPAVGIAVVAGLAHAASADSIPQRARDLAEQGRQLHDAGDYAAAAARFQAAYALAPSPGLLFNLAQDYRLSGDCEDAAIMYQRFLASDPPTQARTVAAQHLDKVNHCLRPTLVMSTTPSPPPLSRDRTPPDTVHADRPRSPRLQKDVGLGFMAAGGVALAGAAYFAFRAHDDSETVSKGYAMGAPWSSLASIDAEGRSSQRDAAILGVGGGIAVASGLTLYLLGVRSEHASVAVTPSTTGAKVAVTWGF